jgi:hypothetical protein
MKLYWRYKKDGKWTWGPALDREGNTLDTMTLKALGITYKVVEEEE